MITAGIDVGSLTSKAVIMKDGKILSSIIIKSKPRPWESADLAINSALEKSGLLMADINCFVGKALSEIACHAKGARWLMPSARTVIDIGGQDCKAMRLDENGEMVKFITNDKCASGTGRFLEVMAKVMGVDVSELGELSSRSKSAITLASACTVWAQADVIQHLNEMTPIEDIAAGINNAMASRMSTLVSSIGIEREVCMTGGVAKNSGVVSSLEKALGIRIKKIRRDDPQLAGAIGAAIYAETVSNGGEI